MDCENLMKACQISGIHLCKPPFYKCKWCGEKHLPEKDERFRVVLDIKEKKSNPHSQTKQKESDE